jgi:hypothetical protein
VSDSPVQAIETATMILRASVRRHRLHGSEGGGAEKNQLSLRLSKKPALCGESSSPLSAPCVLSPLTAAGFVSRAS